MGLGEDILIGGGDDEGGVVRRFKEFLGIQREAFVCPECDTACNETMVHDPARAAFDGGESPAWYCDSCDGLYVREVSDESHTMDIYGRE